MENTEKEGPVEVLSPFASSRASVQPRRKTKSNHVLIGGAGLILALAGIAGGVFLSRHLSDPYRTMEAFPVAKYLEGHRSVSGARFRGDLRVEADLGWKESIGRLMLFSTQQDARPIAVLVPAAVSGNVYFSKGQSYLAELEVKEGGLIYANAIRKH